MSELHEQRTALNYARFLTEHTGFAHSEQELLLAEQFLALDAAYTRELETLIALSDCVMKGWTEPAFARGHLHERAVELARSVVSGASS